MLLWILERKIFKLVNIQIYITCELQNMDQGKNICRSKKQLISVTKGQVWHDMVWEFFCLIGWSVTKHSKTLWTVVMYLVTPKS
jgi:hypothetical protein